MKKGHSILTLAALALCALVLIAHAIVKAVIVSRGSGTVLLTGGAAAPPLDIALMVALILLRFAAIAGVPMVIGWMLGQRFLAWSRAFRSSNWV